MVLYNLLIYNYSEILFTKLKIELQMELQNYTWKYKNTLNKIKKYMNSTYKEAHYSYSEPMVILMLPGWM